MQERDEWALLAGTRELQPGVWELPRPDGLAPLATLRIVRHEGRLMYRADEWRADGEGKVLGYAPTLLGAAGVARSWHHARTHPYEAPGINYLRGEGFEWSDAPDTTAGRMRLRRATSEDGRSR